MTERDITRNKKAELQKEFDENNMKSLINNTADLMWSVDKHLKLITSNKAFEEMLQQIIIDNKIPNDDPMTTVKTAIEFFLKESISRVK